MTYQAPTSQSNNWRRRLGLSTWSVTQVLVITCAVIWIAQLFSSQIFQNFSVVPALTATQPWRLLTGAFLHAGWWHILFNMLTLWVVGLSLEPILGKARYLATYLVCALGGSALFVVLAFPPTASGNGYHWLTGMVGASGAIFGLFGVTLGLQGMEAAKSPLMVLVLINVAMIFLSPGVAWQAHLGGLASGLAIGVWLGRYRRILWQHGWGTKQRVDWGWVGIIAIGVVWIVAVVLKYLLLG